MNKFELGPKDKQRNPTGWGYLFECTNPKRYVPCLVGNLLAPASADDIPPIPESAAEKRRRVTLTKHHRDPKPQLAADRWESKFRWKVVAVLDTVRS